MSLIWGLSFPLPTHLSLTLLGFFVYGIWVLFSWYQSQTQVAAKTETSKQQKRSLKQIRKLRVSRFEETEMNVSVADLTRISGLTTDWTQEYVLWSIDRSLRQIFQHLDNARSTLMELNVSESQDVTSSSDSDIVVQEIVPPSCYCKKGKTSTDYSMSSASSNNSSSLSYLPMFPEGTAWQFQSDSGPVSSQKEPFMPRSRGTSLPTSQLIDSEKSDLSLNLAVLRPLQAKTSFISCILESLDPWEQEKTKDKVSTLGQHVVPLPVKKSWNTLNHFMDVQGVPEEELPKTQLPILIPQSIEQNTNTSPDLPSFHLHMNIGVNSQVHRTEAIISQPFPSNRQSQPEDDRQELRYNPLVISMGTPSPRNLGVNIIQEEQALVKKDSKHVLEPNIEQRVIGLPEKRVQTHKAQLTNVELTPKIPRSATDRIKVTPLALFQVMDLMGITPKSQSELIDSVGFSPEPPNQAETVSITPQPSNQVIERIKVTHHQHQTTELKSMASRLSQVTDNLEVTPVTLFHVTDSMEMIDKLSPHGIEPVGVAPQPQYQVMESVKMDTLHNYQAIRPGSMSRGPQQTVVEAVEMIPQPQHKDMGTLTMTLGSQNQASKHIRITPSPVHQNAMEISSSALPEATEDTKVSPVAKQAMDVMQIFPLGQPHITKSRALIRGSQPPAENLTPVSAQPDVPTTTVLAGTVESRSVPPQPPSKVLEPSGMTDDLLPSCQSLHALKVTPPVQASPTGMITPLQIVEPQTKESLQLTSGLQGQVEDSVGTTPQPQGTECVSLTPKSHHQIMESRKTIPAPPDQGAVPIGRGQKHQVPEAEVVPVIPLLQEMEYFGGSTIPQTKVRDSMDFPPELLNVKSEHLIPDPRLQSVKSVDITTDLVPQIEKYGPPTSTVLCIDLAPELHQQNTQYEELTPIPQLQSETSVPSAPESQFQDVKSGQLTVEPQHQNKKSARLAAGPQLQNNKSVHWMPDYQSQGMEEALSALSQDIQGDIKMVELTQSTGSDKIAPVPLLEDTNTPLVEGRNLIPEALVESMEVGELIPSTHFYATKSLEATPKPSYHFLEPEGLTLQHPASEARVTSEPCQQVEESAPLPQSSLGMTPAPLSQTSESVEMSSPPLQDTLESGTQVVKEMEETPESGSAIKDTLDLLLDLEVQTMTSGVMAPEPQPPDVKFVQVPPELCAEVTNPSERTLKPEHEDTETFRLTVSKVDDTQGTIIDLYSEVRSLEFSLESGVQGEKSESLAQNLKSAEVITEPPLQVVEPTGLTAGPKPHIKDVIPKPQLHEVKSRQMDRESQLQNENSVNVIQPSSAAEVDPEKTKPEPHLQSLSPKQGESPMTFAPGMLFQDKPMEVLQGPHLQDVKPKELTSRPQTQDSKRVIISCLKQQSLKPVNKAKAQGIQGVKFMDLVSTQQYQGRAPMDLTLEPGQDDHISTAEWKGELFNRLNKQLESEGMLSMGSDQEPKPAGRKPIQLNSKLQCKDTPSFELAPEPVVHNVKAQEVQYGPQVPNMKPCPLTPESQVYQVKDLEPMLEPPLQDGGTVALNTEPQIGGTKSVQWIPVSEFQREKCIGSNFRLQSQSASPTELKPSTQRRGVRSSELTVRSKIQGEKSREFHLESQLQQVKTSPLALGLQKTKTLNLTSEPQPQGIKTDQLNKETQVESVRSIQWTPRPEFHGVTFLQFNSGSPSPGVESTERKPSIQLRGGETSEMALGPKPQGKKSVDFNLGPQVQCVKTPELSPGPQLQDGENITSTSELQSQCVKSVALLQGPQLENTKSVLWIPLSDYQVNRSTLNLRLPPQDVTAKELKPSVQLDVKTSDELTTRPKSQGKQPSGSTQEHQSQRSKTTDFKSEQQFRIMKACDPTLRSKINNIKLTFKPRFCLEDRSSPGLKPGIQPQEVNPLGSSPGTQPQTVTPSVFKQESQSSEVKYGAISQRPQSQNNVELKCEKSSELALQTKPRGMKSEKSSGPQWQCAKCSDLTPETESPNMKCTKLSCSSQMKGKPCIELATGTKTQRVKLGCKPGPQWQDIKSNSFLRTKPQEMEMEDWESGPLLQDLKSSRTIMGIKVHDVMSVDFGPGPHLQGMTSEVITGKRVHGTKSVEDKPSSKLQSKKHDFTPRKMFLGTKSVELDSGPPLQDLKYPELIMDMKLQGVNSMGQHVTSIKSSEVVTQIKSQSVTAVDLNSGPQTQNKKPSELVQGKRLLAKESVEFNQGPKLQGVTVESKPPNGESGKLNSDEKYSQSILGTKLQYGRSMEVSPGLCSQSMKSSEVISEDKLQKEKPVGFVYQPLWQDVKSLKWTFGKALDREPLQLETAHLQDRKLTMLTSELHLQGMKPESVNCGSELKGVKSEPTYVHTMKDTGINHGSESQFVGFSKQASDSKIYRVVPSELNARNQKRDRKSHKLSQKQQLQKIKQIAFRDEPHLQHIKSSELCTKLQDLKSMEFNSEQPLQDVISSELGLGISPQSLDVNPGPHLQEIIPFEGRTETKFPDEPSPEFKRKPRLQGRPSCDPSAGPQIHCKNVMASNTGTQNVELSESHPGPDLQGIKSKVFCLEPHLEDVNSACTPNANSQYINTSGCKRGPYLQDINSSACIPEPDLQCIKSVCNPGPHLHGMNSSACILGPKLQGVDYTGCIHEPNWQDVNSSVCTPGPSPQCMSSSVCNPGPSPQCVNSSACTPRPSLQCVNSSVCTPGTSPQCVNSSVCTQGPSAQCVNSICTPGLSFQGVNSSPCSPGPSPPCVNSTECHPEAHLQGVNQWASILGPHIQCVGSTGRNPKSRYQGVNPSSCTPGQNPQCEHSNRCSLEPLLLGMNHGRTFPAPQIMCVNPVWCNTKTHLQDVDSSACTRRQESQSVNSTGYNPGPNLQAPKLQGMKFSESNSGTGIQREMPIIVNKGQHVQDLKFDSTPGSNIIDVAPVEYNPGPQVQCVNFSELNPGLKLQRINPSKLSSRAQLQNMKSFELMPGSESQCPKSVLLNSGPPFQGMMSSHLMVGAEFQEIPFLKNQLGSWQETAQPTFTLRPPSNGVKSVGVSPTPLPEDRMSPEMSNQPLLCLTNSVKVTPGCGLQDVRSNEYSPEPCFQKVKSVKLKPGSPTPSVNPLEFAPGHCSQHTKTSLAPKPCVHERKPMQLRLGSQQQSMDHQQFPLNEKPVVSTPESTGDFIAGPALSSVKFSNLIPESQQQCMKSTEFTSEPKWQSVNHVKLSSVSLPQTGTSRGLSPRPFLQNVTPRNQNPQTRDQIIESSQVIYRPGHQLEDYAEKMRHQVPKFMDFISLPVYQDAGSSEMTKGLGHKSPETTENSMRLTLNPTDQVIELLGMPQQLDLQGPESVDLTPTLSDPDSKSSELTPQRSYWSPETLQLLPCLWPQFKDFKELPTEQATESGRMILDLKNHVAEVRMLTCEVRPGKEFLSVTSNRVNRETGHVEKSPRLCPQDLGPVVVSSGKRSQREHSVAWPPRPSYHIPDSASGITPGQGPQIPESVSLTSQPWLQIEESLDLSTQQTSQVVEDTDCEELTFESWQPGEVASRLTKPQGASLGTLNITPMESLDQMINFITISPTPLNQMTESAKTRLHVSQSDALASVSESVEVISGPPLQVIESVMIPGPASQGSKHADLTPKLHDVIMSEFASRLWLQNVQSRKLIAAPTHQILETIELSGFQVIKTILVPKPLLLIVKSEELAPGPNPQAIEPIGVATKSNIKVMDGLNFLPRPHLQDMVKPMEQTPRANIQENFAELILEQTSPLEEPPVLTHEQRLQVEKSLGIRTESPKVMEIEDLNQRRVCEDRDSEMITSEKLQAQDYFCRFIPSPSIPFISSSVKTTELGPLQGSGMPEVSRALPMKNFAVGILPSPESYTDTIMFNSSALPLVLPSDIGNTVGTLYPDIWEVDVLSEEATEKKQMEEFGNSFQSYSPDPLRLLPSEFQSVLGARRNSIRSFLGRQQNVWESHVRRQRLPRKYLSNMRMLGNVLGTTMERKLCPQPFLTEEATMDICQFIQSLFGVPAELMAFSQSLLERGPRTISQTSVVRNYIQRRILCHGHEKRMPLKTRLGIKKTNSKLSVIFEEVTQNVSVSCTRAQFPALMKTESSLKILYNREDSVSSDQSLLERGPRTISQTSVVRNYIHRHILCRRRRRHEERMPLKMWTRGSTSSIKQQYSGTRLGIKKTNSKISDIFQEVTQHVSVSCTRAQFPALMKPESSLKILYNREDPVSSDQSKDSQSDSPTRTFGSHHSLKARCLSQAKRDISEQLHLLKDLQLKIAAKLLESQVPHNVPPSFSSGVVLKYPICLQCGLCSGVNCCRKLQSAFVRCLLVYPQIHLLSTPEGRGEIQLHLGFRLRTRKRPQVSKHRGRKRADTWKSTTSPSRRKAKIYPPASKSPTTPRDFQARSSQASVQVHIREKQRGSHGVVRQTDTKDSGHHEFRQLHSVSESGFESNQEEKWSKSSLKKTFDLNYPMKETTKKLKTQNTKLYKNSETPEESPFRIMCPSRSKSIETVQTSTVSSKTQPKKSSQPKFYQLLFQGLRQAFQIAHRIAAYTGQKPEDRTRPDNLWSTQYLHRKQRANKYCLAPSVMKELSGGE